MNKCTSIFVLLLLSISCCCSDAEKKTKKLTAGGRRRLSIAEEVVHGLPLLFVDEPVTNVGDLETAIIMKTLREMVNQQRTVVITAHQVCYTHPSIYILC